MSQRPRVLVLVLVLVGLSVVGFSSARFDSPTLPDEAPAVARAPLTERLALVVLDGVRDDRFLALLPGTARLARERGVFCPVECGDITYTVAGIYALGTGDIPSAALIPDNFRARPARVDSLPAAVERSGRRTLLFGERVWHDLFGEHAQASTTERDRGPFAEHASAASSFGASLEAGSCNLCVWHDAGFDAAGHRYGLFAQGYADYARDIDQTIERMVDDDRVTWLVTSDHGMLDNGSHGGDQTQARASFLAAWGPGIRHRECPERARQADIATLAAVLLGAPIPWHSHGVIPDVLEVSRTERAALEQELFEQKRRLASRLAEEEGGSIAAASSMPDYLRIAGAIQQRSRTLSMIAWLLPLAAAIALLLSGRRESIAWLRHPRNAAPAVAIVAFGCAFANVIYVRVSYPTATLVFFLSTAAWLLLGFVVTRGWPRSPRRALRLGVFLAILASADTHWAVHMAAVVVGVGAWCALSRRGFGARVLAVSIGAGCLVLVELAWLQVFALRATSDALPLRGLSVVAAGCFVAWMRRTQPGRVRTAALVAAAGVGAVLVAPLAFRSFIPLAGAAGLLGVRRWAGRFPVSDALGFGLLLLLAAQATPLHFVALLGASALVAWLIESQGIDDSVGPVGADWLRGAMLLSMTYVVTVLEGLRLSLSDVNVLAGFLGGALELHLPLTAALVCLYYAAPLFLATIALERRGRVPRLQAVTLAAAGLALVKLAYCCTSLAWGTMAAGTWSGMLSEALLLALLFTVALGSSMLAWRERRSRSSVPASRR